MRFSLALCTSATTLLLASCGNPSANSYDVAANELCNCMKTVGIELKNEVTDQDTSYNMNELNYSICVVRLSEKIDIRDEKMETSIKDYCPELKETHKDYVKSL